MKQENITKLSKVVEEIQICRENSSDSGKGVKACLKKACKQVGEIFKEEDALYSQLSDGDVTIVKDARLDALCSAFCELKSMAAGKAFFDENFDFVVEKLLICVSN
ncbi:MAG: hypothetical protein MJ133_01845 [Lachnospiraceae bacterium]|nr:hypothetical protein [Lachnospiraceae bacterium]